MEVISGCCIAAGGVGYARHGEATNSFHSPTPPQGNFSTLDYEMDLFFSHCNLKLAKEQAKIGLIIQ